MSNESNRASFGGWKVLTVYFSHSGNTRECARQINQRVGGDLLELTPVQPYPEDYDTVVSQAKRELRAGYRPELKAKGDDVADYDVVFVGSPNWWNTVAPPVMTYLAGYDFADKAIVPFITHEGTGLGQSARDIRDLCPGATVLEGIAIRGGEVNRAGQKLSEWLRKLGIAEAA
ncbi:flavodoxin [Geomonas subterranea]|uniref:Flavodoxin n=1 Tax=Geomonas subterranea TaxID=2847989 RepID=A0ABX8LD28_9BACT|nr:flavodoxin [Geomonas subterranea]QXE89608.1 flavodoxin [Geomonas subterranea]QXM08276.1 flavodoxin [Geomonas subterranea]